MLGRWRRTCARSAEPSLQAQPAPWESAVRRMRGFWSIGVGHPASCSRAVSLLRPDQRPQGDEGPLLLGGRSQSCRRSAAGPAGRGPRAAPLRALLGADRQQRLEGVKEIGVCPGAILRLVGRHRLRQAGTSSDEVGGEGQGVDSGHDRVRREVPVPVVPLLLQLYQAQRVLLDRWPLSSRARSAARSARQLMANRAAGSARNTFPLGSMTGANRSLRRSRGEEAGDEVLAGPMRSGGRGTALAECSRLALEGQHPTHAPAPSRPDRLRSPDPAARGRARSWQPPRRRRCHPSGSRARMPSTSRRASTSSSGAGCPRPGRARIPDGSAAAANTGAAARSPPAAPPAWSRRVLRREAREGWLDGTVTRSARIESGV